MPRILSILIIVFLVVHLSVTGQGIDEDMRSETDEWSIIMKDKNRSIFQLWKGWNSPRQMDIGKILANTGLIRRTSITGCWNTPRPPNMKKPVSMKFPKKFRLEELPSQDPADWLQRQHEERLIEVKPYERVMEVFRLVEGVITDD